MEVVTEIALLVGIAGILLGYLLVVRAGFHREFLWGLINLVPVVSLAFVLLYWRQARLGFLVSVMGIAVVLIALYGGADARLEREMARLGHPVEVPMPVQRPRDTPVPNEAEIRRIEQETGQPLGEMVVENPDALVAIEPLPPPGSFRPQERPRVSRAWRDALEEELPRLVGERMRLQMSTGGGVREGTLTGVTSSSVFLEQVTRQGSVAFEYRLRDVASMAVLDVEGAEPRIPEPEVEPEPVEGVIFAPPAPAENDRPL